MENLTFGQLGPRSIFFLYDAEGVFVKLPFPVVPYCEGKTGIKSEILTAISIRNSELVFVSDDREVNEILG